MSNRIFVLAHSEARRRASAAVFDAPDGYRVTVAPPKRSGEQNQRLWVLLGALADQIVWHGQKLTAEEWKDACTAALKRQRVVPGIDGGFVVLGTRTSGMTKAEMGELQDFIEAFGAQQGVDFNEPATA